MSNNIFFFVLFGILFWLKIIFHVDYHFLPLLNGNADSIIIIIFLFLLAKSIMKDSTKKVLLKSVCFNFMLFGVLYLLVQSLLKFMYPKFVIQVQEYMRSFFVAQDSSFLITTFFASIWWYLTYIGQKVWGEEFSQFKFNIPLYIFMLLFWGVFMYFSNNPLPFLLILFFFKHIHYIFAVSKSSIQKVIVEEKKNFWQKIPWKKIWKISFNIMFFLIFCWSFLWIKLYDFGERLMSDTGHYLFYPQNHEQYKELKESYKILPQYREDDSRDIIDQNYAIAREAYRDQNWELTKSHSSPVIFKSIIAGIDYYYLMPFFHIDRDDVVQQHTFHIIAFHIVWCLFLLWIFTLLLRLFPSSVAYIFFILLGTSAYSINFSRFLNYDPWLDYVWILFLLYLYLFLKEKNIKYWFALGLIFALGINVKWVFYLFFPITLLILVLRYKDLKPYFNFTSLFVIFNLLGILWFIIFWPYTWVEPFKAYFYHLGIGYGFFALVFLYIIFVVWEYLADKVSDNVLKYLKVWVVAAILWLVAISMVYYPEIIFQKFQISKDIGWAWILARIKLSMPQMLYCTNIVVVWWIVLAVMLFLMKNFWKKKDNEFEDIVFLGISFSFLYVFLWSLLFYIYIRYQLPVLGVFLLTSAIGIYDFLNSIKFGKILIPLILVYWGYELYIFMPTLFYYKNQIAPLYFTTYWWWGMLGSVDSFRYIKANSQKKLPKLYMNYEWVSTKWLGQTYGIIWLGKHWQVNLKDEKQSQWDYALFTLDGINTMYAKDRFISQDIYNAYKNKPYVRCPSVPRYPACRLVGLKWESPFVKDEEKK